MSAQLVGQWLKEYGVDEFDGACTFTYKESIDFSVEVSADESHLILSSVVGEIVDPSNAESLHKLLRLNYLGIATQGATLSLDETGTNIVLWISLSIEGLDPERFEHVVSVFLDLSEQLSTAVV